MDAPRPRIDNLTRAELDAAEAKGFCLGGKPMRPRDAATLILIDRREGRYFVLMGRRHRRHVFMPGRFVFPGGRTDPADSRIAVASGLHPAEEAKLIARAGRGTAARARAIALSALRETYEEAGLLIGRTGSFSTRSPHWQGFVAAGVQPALDRLRYIARAVTPPGRVRRFDTRFLAAWRDDVAVELAEPPTDELEEIGWLPIAEAVQLDIPAVTRTVLGDLQRRLETDPGLSPGGPVPFYFMRGTRMEREIL
ncbi:NUDIX domain-containing protein [Chelativorans sp. AA-79]|uniref:NUDIX hydrolase n=1 Tax=Chelativorans sp. AA-79 TaxID=3028735 RepID=UPI0023F98A76|nr:NUDIX domain-containing protein [Chelativorans sp. AA-79]WEX11713.1 NUDIX domain-containing protein [Chelativorans sp. AA-79]